MGIGKGIALALAKQGADVAIADITVEKAADTVSEIEKLKKENALAAKIMGAMDKTIPLKRLGKPEDAGSAVASLASDETEYITG